jgi:Glycoside Hydrolase Family 113
MREGSRAARSALRRRASAALRWGLLAALAACAPDAPRGNYVHFQHLALAREVIVGAASGEALAAARRMLPRLQAELGPTKQVTAVPLEQAHTGARRVRLLLGRADDPELRPALDALGFVAQGAGSLALGQEVFGARGGALVATLDDPSQRGTPLTIFVALGADDAAFIDLDVARELRPTWQPGWQVYVDRGWRVAEGHLGPDGRAVLDSSSQRENQQEPSSSLAEIEGLRAPMRQRALSALDAAVEFDGTEPAIRTYTDAADLARSVRAWKLYHCAPRAGAIDLVSASGLPLDAEAALAEFYARRALGEPAEAWLVDGVARHAAQAWWGKELGTWCAHLQRAGIVPEIEEIVAPAPRVTPHAIAPLRGLLLDVLLETRGSQHVRKLWREGGLIVDEALRQAFAARLQELARRHGGELDLEARGHRARMFARPFRKGIALIPALHRSDPLESGMGSRAGAAALQRMASHGADSVSLEVAAFLERPWSGSALESQPWPPAQVADLEIAAACAAARANQLGVLLDPSLWLAPGATLAGATLVHTPNEWRLFFEAHRRFLEHYALLAELCGAELLSLGSELGNAAMTSRERGDPRWSDAHYEWKRGRWEAEIRTVRKAFSGGLTYAARWDEALDSFSFWKDLDFIGLDLFAPLVADRQDAQAPQLDVLTTRLWSSLTLAEVDAAAFGKRLLVLEVGFPSAHDSWRRPARPEGPADDLAQGLFYAALGIQVKAQRAGRGDLAGLYAWCWSADEDGGASWERGYTLQGKRSEAALERAFSEP